MQINPIGQATRPPEPQGPHSPIMPADRPISRASYDPTLMRDLARFIEKRCDESITLARLAREAHFSPSHLQRCFKRAIGISPKQYQESCRLRRFKQNLREAKGSVTDAVYNAGFGSPSRVYENIDHRLGMTPKVYQAQGAGLTIHYACGDCNLGPVLIGATERGVCFLQFGDSEQSLRQALGLEFPNARIEAMLPINRPAFDSWMEALSNYLRGETTGLDMPLDIAGTAFQGKVWKYLQGIPYGQTKSYAEVAAEIGRPTAVRSVASACARNRIAIAIPCHRVIRGDGDLAGYRWGLECKRRLLAMEAGTAD